MIRILEIVSESTHELLKGTLKIDENTADFNLVHAHLHLNVCV